MPTCPDEHTSPAAEPGQWLHEQSPDPGLLVRAYLAGAFPMADAETGEVHWYSPDPRGVLPFTQDDPLGEFRVRRSLAKRVRHGGFEVTIDRAFSEVIRACAKPRPEEPETWISEGLIASYNALHEGGIGHSVEAWHGGELVGGLYGLSLGGAFFGESMFSRRPDASQVCLVHLVDHLRARGFTLLDVQLTNPHLLQFGVVEIPRSRYLQLLEAAVTQPVTWHSG